MDEQAKKKTILMIPYGLYVVGPKQENEIGAFTINWRSQASLAAALAMGKHHLAV